MPPILSIALPIFGLIGGVAGRAGFLSPCDQRAEHVRRLPVAARRPVPGDDAHPAAKRTNGARITSFYVGIAVPGLIALTLALRHNTSLGNAMLQAMGATSCNSGYMDLPLCRMVFGNESLMLGGIYLVITAYPQFALAIALIEMDRPSQTPLRIAITVGTALIRNLLLISPIAGLLVSALGLILPPDMERFLTILGSAATPCALVAAGRMVAESTERFRPLLVGRLVVLKLPVQPAVSWIVAYHLVDLPPVWGWDRRLDECPSHRRDHVHPCETLWAGGRIDVWNCLGFDRPLVRHVTVLLSWLG